MALSTWWLFVTLAFVISATPGPNMLHVMVQSIHHGPRRAIATMAGLLTAILLYLLASAMGLGAILKAAPHLFDALRYAGVGYLLWLGIKAWRAEPMAEQGEAATPARSLRSLYVTGFLTGLANPKLIIFAAAFFPQFIDPARPFAVQLLILVASCMVIESGWYMAYALGGRSFARGLAPANRQRLFNRATALLFVGFGGALLGARV